jgi:uncharacterized protein YbjT (DUF2867 family)
MSTVLVTGGTGLLGRHVVRRLVATGHTVRVLTRHAGASAPDAQPVTGDLSTGDGLDEAVAGVDGIVHAASDPRSPGPVDVEGTGALLAAARRGGSPHLVYVSIVGVDRIPLAYYRAKSVAEQLVEESGLPWTILRATQFHEFTADLLRGLTRPPIAVLPRGCSNGSTRDSLHAPRRPRAASPAQRARPASRRSSSAIRSRCIAIRGGTSS